MKRICLVLLIISFTSATFSQPWRSNLPTGLSKGQLTLNHYKDAFNQYWAPFNVDKGYYILNGVKTKAMGWKQFKRWEYDMENLVNPLTGEFPMQSAFQVNYEYRKVHPALKSLSFVDPSNWVSLGPTGSTGGYAGVGRINCVAFHPTDVNTWWVGAAAGGLWVTTNNGSSWTCLTNNTGVLAVSDILIPSDYATSNTIYIATGDRDHWDNNSIGVLKSIDGGITWNATGISYLISDGSMVFKLLMDPANSQSLIAATSLGVYKTVDGGTTWGTKLSAISFVDMEYKPGDFNTLYGSTTGGSIYLSSNGGATWTQAFSDPNARRIDLCVSANQAASVYAVAANAVNGLYGIYKSTDSGKTYAQAFVGSTKNLLGWASDGSDTGGQGWYDLTITASPSNADIVLIGGINTWRSTDAGVTWTIADHWYGSLAQAVHADKHMLKYRTDGSLFECNDGGVYLSTNDGTSWTDKTTGIVNSQMYKLGVSQSTNNETITGLQDNGTKLYSGGSWNDVKGGDGMECLIDYTNANIQYGTYVNGQIDRTTDHWSTVTDISANIPGGPSGSWVTPYLIDPINPLILYVGYSNVWKTTDRGNTWTQVSQINTASKIRSMAIAPSNTNVLYVADPSIIWKTTDNGTTWNNITGSLPVSSGNITYLQVKNDDENTLWVTLSGYSATKVFQSVDGGFSWADISAGLPPIPAYTIVQNKQITNEIQLYAGTEVGIYFKKGADNWISFNTGLPNVKVGELEIYYSANPANSKLRAATFGRGLWESPVFYSSSPMTYNSATTTQNDTTRITQNQTNQVIIGIQVVTDGYTAPLNATSFTFNTAGSTNCLNDISSAKVYYTGITNSFSASTQFGSGVFSPDGQFTISGNQVLSPGTNFFWLTYDVPSSAVFGDYLDAQCTSIIIGDTKIPVIVSPSGKRIIGNYCLSGATSANEYISNVNLGTINQASGRGIGGYQDYTSQSASLQIGVNYNATIKVVSPSSTDQILIWIDWNNNGIFTDPGENVYTSTGSFASPITTTTISPPAGSAEGQRRMRIRLHNPGRTGSNSTPCGNSTRGEVEDYTIYVTPAVCQSPAAPVGQPAQYFCPGFPATVAGLLATGSGIKWYSQNSGGLSLALTNNITDNTHYYASQTVHGCESTTRLDVIARFSTIPLTPVIGSVTQPTCITATGSVDLSGLPASGSWTVTESLSSGTITGTGTTATFSGLATGTHSFTVTNSDGCTSAASTNAVINSQPPPSSNKQLIVNVFLEGAFNTQSGLMNTTLNDYSLVPLSQPYNVAPWNYAGKESVVSIPAGVIDWVIVELRDAATPAQALPATVLPGWPRAYFLKSDGTVVDMDGTSYPTIGNPVVTGNLYVVIRHRNHVSVMSAAGMTSNCDNYTYNFSDLITKAYGGSSGFKQIGNNVCGMVSGDADSDGNISVLDFSQWATDFGLNHIYLPSDIDEDGGVTVLDFSKWATNFGVGNIVPLRTLIIPDPFNLLTIKYKSQVPGTP